MKNVNKTVKAILGIAMVSLIFVACTKEEMIEVADNSKDNTENVENSKMSGALGEEVFTETACGFSPDLWYSMNSWAMNKMEEKLDNCKRQSCGQGYTGGATWKVVTGTMPRHQGKYYGNDLNNLINSIYQKAIAARPGSSSKIRDYDDFMVDFSASPRMYSIRVKYQGSYCFTKYSGGPIHN